MQPLPFSRKKAIIVFAAYAKEDIVPLRQFKMVLEMVKDLDKVTCYDRDISPGREWQQEELEHLKSADLILILVSWRFITSAYCKSELLGEAIERHKNNQARVVPIIFQSCPWTETALKVLSPLPEDGKPVKKWSSWDEALLNIFNGIKKVVEELQTPSSFKRYRDNQY